MKKIEMLFWTLLVCMPFLMNMKRNEKRKKESIRAEALHDYDDQMGYLHDIRVEEIIEPDQIAQEDGIRHMIEEIQKVYNFRDITHLLKGCFHEQTFPQ